MQTEHAGKASAYTYVQVIFSATLGWLLFNEIPTIGTVFGAVFITGGALVNVLHQRKDE
jgi:drug/metabolite transporter (DMT)-like permease